MGNKRVFCVFVILFLFIAISIKTEAKGEFKLEGRSFMSGDGSIFMSFNKPNKSSSAYNVHFLHPYGFQVLYWNPSFKDNTYTGNTDRFYDLGIVFCEITKESDNTIFVKMSLSNGQYLVYDSLKEVGTNKSSKANIKLSKDKLDLSFAGKKSATLTATLKGSNKKTKWKSLDKKIATVDKNGKVQAKSVGKTKIEAKIGNIKSYCTVNVKDYDYRTVSLKFKNIDEWKKQINKEESSLVFGGSYIPTMDGKTYYTGKIITEKKVLSYKVIETKVSINTPGHYKKVKIKLPNKIKYKLHSHSMKRGYGVAGYLASDAIVLVQNCSCGYRSEWRWEIPWDDGKGGDQNTNDVLKAIPKQKVIKNPRE